MPISIIEQIKIISGETKPKGAEKSRLAKIVEVSLMNHATLFMSSAKQFPTSEVVDGETVTINAEASVYKSKMQSECSKIKSSFHGRYLNSAIGIMASVASPNITDVESVKEADEERWAEFLDSHGYACIEQMASVTAEEKAAYDAITV